MPKNEEIKKVGIVGLGNMGKVLSTLLAQADYEVHGYDIADEKSLHLSKKVHFTNSLNDFYRNRMPVLMAVKPNQIKKTIERVPDNRLIISIAAGITYSSLAEARRVRGALIRAMPNTPLQLKNGATVLFAGESCSEDDIDFAMDLFNVGGTCQLVKNESMLHAVTALSGSGPAYLYLLAQNMEDAAVMMGLSRDLARELTIQTLIGASTMLKKRSTSAQDLIHEVTSPAGTTTIALKTLKRYGFENAIQEAISKATMRSVELGKAHS